jgi:hypothetical protein
LELLLLLLLLLLMHQRFPADSEPVLRRERSGRSDSLRLFLTRCETGVAVNREAENYPDW